MPLEITAQEMWSLSVTNRGFAQARVRSAILRYTQNGLGLSNAGDAAFACAEAVRSFGGDPLGRHACALWQAYSAPA